MSLRNTVAVSCQQGAEWTVYVPVMLESEGPVLVTTRAVARGDGLTAADVEARIQRVPGLASHFVVDPGDLTGRHARRALSAGTVVSNDLLATDLLIKRGQQVTLLASVGGIEVRASGKALTDGGAADRVRVQNLNSLRIVEGLVESADIVRISP
jgi:flagellar basal body P-ring formation protein FlgA